MLDAILNFFKILFYLFKSMPEEHQEAFKQKAADLFDEIFRKYYRQASNG